ncbi:MAG TPA: DUF1634 domain-containing protein [Candidatus Limnocylindria bacterium]|nr:DUF1634 domain-containing protein [Candidatus Limnocylindria bacterium]
MRRRPAAADDRLATLLTLPLRVGTGAAVVLVAIGLALRWLGPPEPAVMPHTPLIDIVMSGGAPAVTSIGLLLLTLVPLAVAIGAVIGFWRSGERRYLVGSAVVAGLLVASLLVSLLLLAPST